VFSRLGGRLRVAGTAELAGYDTAIDDARCERILARVFDLFPDAGQRMHAEFWAGLRPATPGNVPLIGRTRYDNLFLNTGHGTLGWTLACGSGRALAEIVSRRDPGIMNSRFPRKVNGSAAPFRACGHQARSADRAIKRCCSVGRACAAAPPGHADEPLERA
jgi:glycine/D-amino acid oxidase-like deaminating enzyme